MLHVVNVAAFAAAAAAAAANAHVSIVDSAVAAAAEAEHGSNNAGDLAAGFGLAGACAELADALLDCDAGAAAPILWADRMLELENCTNRGKSTVDKTFASHVVASMGNAPVI